MNAPPTSTYGHSNKGAGEAGAIGAPPAVINAICNALDIDHVDMPAKPEKLWKIISQNNKVSAAE